MAIFLAVLVLCFMKAVLTELGRMSHVDSTIVMLVIGIPTLIFLDLAGYTNSSKE